MQEFLLIEDDVTTMKMRRVVTSDLPVSGIWKRFLTNKFGKVKIVIYLSLIQCTNQIQIRAAINHSVGGEGVAGFS